MNRLILTLIVSLMTVCTFAQTNLYENPNFDALTKDHKIIAILPFDATVTLRPKQMKDLTKEQLAQMEESEGESVQAGMYSWFLKREKRGDMRVKVQDVSRTNALLKKNNVSYETLSAYTPEELAKLLEVDAVITGKFETNKPMSEGASIALGALIGFWGATNKAVMNLYIHNAADGELLVSYTKEVNGSIGSSTEDLINILMRKASRRIAYSDNQSND